MTYEDRWGRLQARIGAAVRGDDAWTMRGVLAGVAPLLATLAGQAGGARLWAALVEVEWAVRALDVDGDAAVGAVRERLQAHV